MSEKDKARLLPPPGLKSEVWRFSEASKDRL